MKTISVLLGCFMLLAGVAFADEARTRDQVQLEYEAAMYRLVLKMQEINQMARAYDKEIGFTELQGKYDAYINGLMSDPAYMALQDETKALKTELDAMEVKTDGK